jgi:hypothetical protein
MIRRLALLVVIVISLSGCIQTTQNGQTTLTLPRPYGAVIPPFLTGLWGSASANHADEITPYLAWWRGSGGTKPTTASAILDPACPLVYDYKTMANETWGAGWDGLRIANVNGAAGFYNPARMEVLFLLKGSAVGSSGVPGVTCYDRNLNRGFDAYLPVRLNLLSGTWIIDGWASPGATITIAIEQGIPPAPLKGPTEVSDSIDAIVSPFRLNRFQITDENFRRVVDFATVKRRYGLPRRIVWFRTSDIAPSYAHLAEGTACSPAVFAFWGKNDKVTSACGQAQVSDFGSNDSMYIDRMARMSGKEPVTDFADDDDCPQFSPLSCAKLDNGTWQKIADQLFELAKTANASGKSDDRRKAIDEIKRLLGPDRLAQNAPPDAFGGWDHLDTNVFGIIASGGRRAYDDTVGPIKDWSELQPMAGFVGSAQNPDDHGITNSVTISPSFSYAEVSTNESAQTFYTRYSTIGERRSFTVMAFSTETAPIEYEQGPLAKLSIMVTDTLSPGYNGQYVSQWLPLFAIGRNTQLTFRQAPDILSDFGGAISYAIYNTLFTIYRSTVGSWVATLASQVTTSLLAVPTLEPYRVSYLRPDGTPVYAIRRDLIDYGRIKGGRAYDELIVDGTDDTALCTYAAQTGLLNDPNATVTVGNQTRSVSVCYEQNPIAIVYGAARGLSIALAIFFVGRYFFGLMTGIDRRKISLTGFFGRFVFVLALIVGMDLILRVLAAILAEVILITNIIGTQLGQGEPYSHLWIFSKYLNTPTHDANVFDLFLAGTFAIAGFVVLLIVNWLRLLATFVIVSISPLLVISLLYDQQAFFVYASLRWFVRLYLIPFFALVTILVLYAAARFVDASGLGVVGSFCNFVIGLLMVVAVAVAPILLAKYLVGAVVAPIEARIKNAFAEAAEAKINTQLEAVATWDGGQRNYAFAVGADQLGFGQRELYASSNTPRQERGSPNERNQSKTQGLRNAPAGKNASISQIQTESVDQTNQPNDTPTNQPEKQGRPSFKRAIKGALIARSIDVGLMAVGADKDTKNKIEADIHRRYDTAKQMGVHDWVTFSVRHLTGTGAISEGFADPDGSVAKAVNLLDTTGTKATVWTVDTLKLAKQAISERRRRRRAAAQQQQDVQYDHITRQWYNLRGENNDVPSA